MVDRDTVKPMGHDSRARLAEFQFESHTLAKTGNFLVLLEVRVLHLTTCERACITVSRNRVKPGWSAPEAQGWQELEGCMGLV